MIAVIKPSATEEQIENLTVWLKDRGLNVHISKGEMYTVLGLIGDTSRIDTELLEGLEIVDSVKRISEPFKAANRKFHPGDSIIEVGGLKIGGPNFQIMAGPCSVESAEQILAIAQSVHASGASILRGSIKAAMIFSRGASTAWKSRQNVILFNKNNKKESECVL